VITAGGGGLTWGSLSRWGDRIIIGVSTLNCTVHDTLGCSSKLRLLLPEADVTAEVEAVALVTGAPQLGRALAQIRKSGLSRRDYANNRDAAEGRRQGISDRKAISVSADVSDEME
jgi:hypothetical protein